MMRKALGYWKRVVCWRQGHMWEGWEAFPNINTKTRHCVRCGRHEATLLDWDLGIDTSLGKIAPLLRENLMQPTPMVQYFRKKAESRHET